jgi:hypothetical protein
MLSSRKEENRLHIASPNTSHPTFASVGKVFDSLQGLQQRLDDFSLDDLSKAIETSNTLGLRLAELRRRLESLVEIRRALTEASSVIEQATAEILARANLETADRPPRLRERLLAGNLIQFPRPTKLDSDDGRSTSQPVVETDAVNNSDVGAQLTEEHSPIIQTTDIQPTNAAENDADWPESSPLSEFDPPEEPAIEAVDAAPEAPPSVNFTLGEPDLSINSKASRPYRVDDVEIPVNTAASDGHELPDTLGPHFLEPDTEPASPTHELPVDTANKTRGGDVRALVPVGPDFDQRLLDDLIKDYGEFASSPNVPVPIKSEDDGRNQKKLEGPKASTTSLEESHAATRHLPSIQKEGEIDRKLKKLIKDYGEYDLYSRQSPVNLKTGVIAAFLLLGVIFCGFYFFAAPKAVDTSEPTLISEPAAVSTQTGRNFRDSRIRGDVKAPKSPRGAPVQLPHAAEASEPNALP